MTLGQAQELFVRLETQWVAWCLTQPGWELRHGEGRILELGPDGKTGRNANMVVGGETASRVRVRDAVHLSGGAHYMGTGADWLLFVDGKHITQTDDPAWQKAGAQWKRLHELARWGGDFAKDDGNHISVLHNGMS